MKKLIISVVLLVGAATPAFAKYSDSEYCANMHTVMAREEEALLRADPEMAHNFRYAMYELSETQLVPSGKTALMLICFLIVYTISSTVVLARI